MTEKTELNEIEQRDGVKVDNILQSLGELESKGLADILAFQIIQGVNLFNLASSGKNIDVSESVKFISELLGIDFDANLRKYIKEKLVPEVMYSGNPIEDDFTDDEIVDYIIQNSKLTNESVDKYKRTLSETIQKL